MTIEIIKPADLKRLDPKRRFICRKCAIEFTANLSDFRPCLSTTGSGQDFGMKCPTSNCGSFIWWVGHADKDTDPY